MAQKEKFNITLSPDVKKYITTWAKDKNLSASIIIEQLILKARADQAQANGKKDTRTIDIFGN